MTENGGGCLCGGIRYLTCSEPVRVTFCHCRFCQRTTGSAYLVEPIFQRSDFQVTEGVPTTYVHRSEGSGKIVTIHFCATCSTKLFLSFERYPEIVGVYGGSFDDPNWYRWNQENSKHIFLEAAQHGTIIPAGIPSYRQHSTLNDGTPVDPLLFDQPHTIGLEETH